jgi:cell wall-associated NlpC family hydrolase
VPVDIAVNPDPPAAPVPTGTADPSVRSDPTTPAVVDPGQTPSPSGTPAPIDCSPSTGGRSTAFDPGMIISDAVFYNSRSMTAANIRTFVNSKGAGCNVAACLKSLRVTTPDEPSDKYCAAYPGGIAEDVATILQKLSVACGINPQVMLVTLQKESALLTRTDVTMTTYDAAYGWHCPDSGPGGSANCDPQYAGFFNQAYGMAKQWARYRIDPGNYNFHAGQTTTIAWNVAPSGCGGSTVLIRNTATASLYDYTPYQPNAAALAAYPGVGDRCSTYGNRNFFFLFQKYFGTTGGGVVQSVYVNGVNVTIPAGPNVAPGAAGAVIKAPTAAVAKGLAAGLASVGLPYVWGGGTNGGPADQGCARAGGAENSCQGIVGFDCSGLTGYVLSQSGVQIPDYSGAQRAAGRPVPWSQGRPGDIIGYQGHVAVYLGVINGVPYLLEAPDVGMFVQIRPVYYANAGVPVDSVLHRYWG